MRPLDLIRKKRDGGELSSDEIGFLVRAYTNDEIPDYQMAAWLMAVLIRGMTGPELSALTAAMLHSGEVLDLSDLPGPKVDKHSTGGVGDKTSLIIAPIVAAAGVTVPMISGRGLGHTGGTLDKLQSIPGFNINLSLSEFRRVLKSCGCGLIGQTAEIAPADKKLYALRDVTATVESPNLICASIMSKKLAEGIDGLVLDVKTGSGAFMKTEKDSVHLAELMVETGERMGKKMVALITDMDQPLGLKVGNALEVEECIEVMNGGGPADLREVSVELAAWMFYLGGRTPSVDEGRELADKLIRDHSALKKFREIVIQQGGDPRCIDDPRALAPGAASDASPQSGQRIRRVHPMRAGGNCQPDAGRRPRKERRRDRPRRRARPAQESRRSRSGRRSALHGSLQLRRPARAARTACCNRRIVSPRRPPAEKRPLIHRVISGKGAQA